MQFNTVNTLTKRGLPTPKDRLLPVLRNHKIVMGGRLQADSELKLSRVTVWRSQIRRKDHNDDLKFK